MKTFDFTNTPVVPLRCLWVSGLLLESGSRATAGVPRLYRARHRVGNRLAMGEKVPDAWGASGTDPSYGMMAGIAALWAGGTMKAAVTFQMPVSGVILRSPEFLVSGLVPFGGAHTSDTSEASPPSAEGTMPVKKKALFIPKPDPWRGSASGNGKTQHAQRPGSFCRKVVKLAPPAGPVG